MLAVDPASGGTSDPGFAYAVGGRIVESGIIPLDRGRRVEHRLRQLYLALFQLYAGKVDILVVERLRGRMVPAQLTWSVGVIMAATCVVDLRDDGSGLPAKQPVALELPISTWKRYAKADPDYTKTDENDARMIMTALLALAGEV